LSADSRDGVDGEALTDARGQSDEGISSDGRSAVPDATQRRAVAEASARERTV